MGFWDKIKQGAKVAQSIAPLAGALGVPGAGQISGVVGAIIKDPADPQNEQALRTLAQEVDRLREYCVVLNRRLQALEL